MAKFVLLKIASAAILVLALWNLHIAVKPRPVVEKPPAVCFGRYNTDAACRRSIDSYYKDDHQVSSLITFFVCLLALAALYWFSLKWLVPYLEAVAKVTGGAGSANMSMFLLFMYSPGAGMLIIQNRFNKLAKPPGSSAMPQLS